MGIQIQLSALQDSPEIREEKKRAALKKRVFILSSSLAVALLARLLIKDPPPPKVPDRTNTQVRYVPGMLKALPASERAKLDPKIIAKMMEADELARKGSLPKPETALAQGPYKPSEPFYDATENKQETDQFAFKKPRKSMEMAIEPIDTTKTMVVQFREGGFIRAEQAAQNSGQVNIRVNRALLAHYPTTLVANIQSNALQWKEPITPGYVQFKPAKGITLTLKKDVADRIIKRLEISNEI